MQRPELCEPRAPVLERFCLRRKEEVTMQLELAPEVEASLEAESKRLGLTPDKLSARILAEHAQQWAAADKTKPSAERDKFLADYIAESKRRSPDWETADPYAIDWQAIKAEGWKY